MVKEIIKKLPFAIPIFAFINIIAVKIMSFKGITWVSKILIESTPNFV